MHSKTKHIDIQHHFLRDHGLKTEVEITFVDTHDKLAKKITKPFAKVPIFKIRREMGSFDEINI